MLIDLQVHSYYSDGFLSPKELVKFLKKREVKVASLTDHNTISGLEEFRQEAEKYKIKTVNGLELYVKYKQVGLNILWYNFDENSLALQKLLSASRKRRAVLVKNILLKLKDHGYKINIDKLLSEFNDYIPVNRLGAAVTSSKFNYNLVLRNIRKRRKGEKIILPLREDDVLGELFFNKKIGRLNESYIGVDQILKIKKEAGGQIIFCHPGKYNKFAKSMTEKLKGIGLIDGIEVLSPHHSIGAVMYSQFLANKLDLIATGGSDFHLSEGSDFEIQNSWDWFKIDSRYLRRIKEIIS